MLSLLAMLMILSSGKKEGSGGTAAFETMMSPIISKKGWNFPSILLRVSIRE
jgi:hypothetical protein